MSVGPRRAARARPRRRRPRPTTRGSPRGPSPRSAATSSHSLAIAASSMTPASSVSDDVPILATTRMRASRSQVRLVLEAELADPHDVAVLGAGAGQHLGHAEALRAGRRCSDSASGVVTSFSATTRSTSRPCSRNSCSPTRSTSAPLGLGSEDDDARRAPAASSAGLVHERRHLPDESRTPCAGDGRHDRSRPIRSRRARRLHASALVPTTSAGPLEQLRAGTRRARAAGSAPARPGVTPSSGGEVEQHAQHPGPLDVAQELVPEARALAGALDQPGDVGDDELGVVVERARRRGAARAW